MVRPKYSRQFFRLVEPVNLPSVRIVSYLSLALFSITTPSSLFSFNCQSILHQYKYSYSGSIGDVTTHWHKNSAINYRISHSAWTVRKSRRSYKGKRCWRKNSGGTPELYHFTRNCYFKKHAVKGSERTADVRRENAGIINLCLFYTPVCPNPPSFLSVAHRSSESSSWAW